MGVYQGVYRLSRGYLLEGVKLGLLMATQQKLPSDLITTREAVDQLGIGYWRLHNWFQRGVIRSWKMGRLRLVSRAEVRRELRKQEVVKPVMRKPFMGEVEAPLVAARAAPRSKKSATHRAPSPTSPLPELPDLPPGLSWDYTGS